jgi:hypothetical protein
MYDVIDDVRALKAHSRGKQFLRSHWLQFWFIYVEPLVSFAAFIGVLGAMFVAYGALLATGGMGALFIYGHFFLNL